MQTGSENGNGAAAAEGALHVAFVLDKSGSMQAVEEAVVGGYNDYLGELRSQGGETRFSLTTFDTGFEHVWVGEPLETVAELDHRVYRPDGMTALYDAIAHTVLRTEQRLQADGRGEEKVLVVVMTDGLENSWRLRRAHDRRARPQLRRAAQLDVRLPGSRTRQHRGRSGFGRADGLQASQRDALDRPIRRRRGNRCARSPTPPTRAATPPR